jgi:hypothetical protein
MLRMQQRRDAEEVREPSPIRDRHRDNQRDNQWECERDFKFTGRVTERMIASGTISESECDGRGTPPNLMRGFSMRQLPL